MYSVDDMNIQDYSPKTTTEIEDIGPGTVTMVTGMIPYRYEWHRYDIFPA